MKRVLATITMLALLCACSSNASDASAPAPTAPASAAQAVSSVEASTAEASVAQAQSSAPTEETEPADAPSAPASEDDNITYQEEVFGLKYEIPATWTPADNLPEIKMYDASGNATFGVTFDNDTDAAALSLEERIGIQKEVHAHRKYTSGEATSTTVAGLNGFRISYTGTTSHANRGDFTGTDVVLPADDGVYLISFLNNAQDTKYDEIFEQILAGMTR